MRQFREQEMYKSG